MLYLGIEHNLVPLSGITSLDFDTLSFTEKCLDVIHHLFLPVLVSTVGALAGTSRFLRSSMLEVLRQDYILTAKAKGLTKKYHYLQTRPKKRPTSRNNPAWTFHTRSYRRQCDYRKHFCASRTWTIILQCGHGKGLSAYYGKFGFRSCAYARGKFAC